MGKLRTLKRELLHSSPFSRDHGLAVVSVITVRGLISSDYILDETITLIHAALSHSIAVKFAQAITSSKATRLLYVGQDNFAKALDLLDGCGTANLGFRAWYQTSIDPGEGARIAAFIPVYLSFLVPVVFLDFASGKELRRVRVVLFATLVATFASFLGGFYSLVL